MAKSKQISVKIEKFSFPNIGIARNPESRDKIQIKRALPGQVVEARVKRGKGQLLNVIERAQNEVAPLCPNADKCGGCTFQTLPYEYELELKRNMVLDLFDKAGITLPIERERVEARPAPNVYEYRNKMEFSFGDECKDGPLALGLRGVGSHYEVCDGSVCNICHPDFNKIVECVRDFFRARGASFYHKTRRVGHLRHLVVRRGEHTGEILINLVTASGLSCEGFAEALLSLALEGHIRGILHTTNESVADVVRADEVQLLYGEDFFYDECLGLKFKIYPFSFFQTNTLGAEELYKTVREFAKSGADIAGDVFDLYCGTGTIAQILSESAERVFGIEIVESAIVAARENAALNNIDNCEFIEGDVSKATLEPLMERGVRPDVIIVDPPRDGVHPKSIMPIIDFGAKKIVYVSCKPTSLVRDLAVFLENGYLLKDIRVHDMFARSYHVETVVLLERE